MKRAAIAIIGVVFIVAGSGIYYLYLEGQKAQAEYDYFVAASNAYSKVSERAVPKGIDKFSLDAPTQLVTQFFVYSKANSVREDTVRLVLDMYKAYLIELEKLSPPISLVDYHQSTLKRVMRKIELWGQALILAKDGLLTDEMEGIEQMRKEFATIQSDGMASLEDPKYKRFWTRYAKELEKKGAKEAIEKLR
ncbi:MAG: hypothetical protein AMXMBFR7_49850 [Planctomycetota bacterium]